MSKVLVAVVLLASVLVGCTAQQLQTAESVAHAAVVDAKVTLQAAKSNPALVAALATKINAVLPHTTQLSAAGAKLQTAWAAYQAGAGPLEDVEAALNMAEPVLAPQATPSPAPSPGQ